MVNAKEIYVIEWSPSAKQIQIQSLEQTIRTNIHIAHEYQETKFVPDYIVVGVTDSREEAMQISDEIEKNFK